jgi:hypothetical protein
MVSSAYEVHACTQVSRATIKDTPLEASIMLLLVGGVTCGLVPDAEGQRRQNIAWRTVSLASPGLCRMRILVAVAHGADMSV